MATIAIRSRARQQREPYRPRHAAMRPVVPSIQSHEQWLVEMREKYPLAFADPGPVVFDLDRWMAAS